MLGGIIPERSVEAILSERLRFTLRGPDWEFHAVLPVLSRRANREWLGQLEARLSGLLRSLRASEDVETTLQAILLEQDALVDLLVSYDRTGILPSRDEIDEHATNQSILRAVLEVWQAANPLVAIARWASSESLIDTTPSEATRQPSPSGAGPTDTSRTS